MFGVGAGASGDNPIAYALECLACHAVASAFAQGTADVWQALGEAGKGWAKDSRGDHIDALVAESLPPDETLLLGDLLQLLGRDLASPVRLGSLLPVCVEMEGGGPSQ